MEQNYCKTCQHFRQHYGKFGKRYNPINCGHCVRPRLKTRKPDTPACERYQERE